VALNMCDDTQYCTAHTFQSNAHLSLPPNTDCTTNCCVQIVCGYSAFCPPKMAALIGPSIGARNRRQDEFAYTALRALAQHKPNKTYILFMPLILYCLTTQMVAPTGPIKTVPATPPPWWGGHTAPNKLHHTIYSCPEGHEILPKPPTRNQHTYYTYACPQTTQSEYTSHKNSDPRPYV
jgi:hypothetical protein